MTKQEIEQEAKQRATACIEWVYKHNSDDPNFITNQFLKFADSIRDKTLVNEDGNPITAETLKNACEIVRTTTKQKMIDKACETYCNVCYNKTTDCKEFCNDVNIFRQALGMTEQRITHN